MSRLEDFWGHHRYVLIGVLAEGRTLIPMIHQAMRRAGLEVGAVDAGGGQFLGQAVHRSVSAAGGPFDAAVILEEPGQAEEAVRECIEAGIRRVWLDTRGDSRRAAEVAREAGLEVVAEECPLIAIPQAGLIHALHRGILKCIGKWDK